jgi:hypothetical protein
LNVSFITFSPFAKEYIKDNICKSVASRTFFFHHPVEGEAVDDDSERDKLRMLAYGQSVNNSLSMVLKAIKDMGDLPQIDFTVLRRCGVDNMDLTYLFPKFVRIKQHYSGFSKRDLISNICSTDWIIIPYLANQYLYSMSGILADAIRYEKPVLAINFNVLQYYNNPPIGIVADSPYELGRIIASESLLNDRLQYDIYKSNIRQIKRKMYDENVAKMRDILGDN